MVWYSGKGTEKSLATKVDNALSKSDCEQHPMDRSNLALIERIEMIRSQLITTASILGPLAKSITPISSLAKELGDVQCWADRMAEQVALLAETVLASGDDAQQ